MGYDCSEREREEEFDTIHMVKITVEPEQQPRQLVLEGTLAGVWVNEVRRRLQATAGRLLRQSMEFQRLRRDLNPGCVTMWINL